MKKNKRLFATDGSVSIYLIMIIVPIFLFNAVFIDYSRIKLAGKESEAAVKAGVRSTLSAFDTKVQAYGLFGQGLGQFQNLNLFTEVLNANLSARDDQFQYAKPILDPGASTISSMYTLADQIVFKRQILEEMKYKAPIEFTLNIIDKLKTTKVTQSLKQASQFEKKTKQIDELMDKRDDKLDEAWNQVEKLAEQFSANHSSYRGKLERLNELSVQIGDHIMDEVKASIAELTKQIDELKREVSNINDQLYGIQLAIMSIHMSGAATQEMLLPLYDLQSRLTNDKKDYQLIITDLSAQKEKLEWILGLIMTFIALLKEIKEDIVKDDTRISDLGHQITNSLNEAKKFNMQIRYIVMSGSEGKSGQTGPHDEDGQALQEQQEELEAEKVLEKAAIEDDYFHQYETGVGSALSLFHGFKLQLEQATVFQGPPYDELILDNERYYDVMQQFYVDFIEREQERTGKRDEIRKRKTYELKKLQDTLDKVKEAITGCPASAAENGKKAYSKLQGTNGDKGIYSKYLQYNDISEQTTEKADIQKADKTGSYTFRIMDGLLAALESLRDELYMNEYALTKFNYRTMEKAAENGVDSNKLPDPYGHILYLQEAEYIMYGFDSCEANYSSAYAEMFSFRLAIRTMEFLMEPQNELLNIGSPLLLLLAALAEGAVKAYGDMDKLINGENVIVSNKLSSAIQMNYKDYLRLFMILHSSDRNTMARMQALIEMNTGRDLSALSTYVQGTGITSIKLWFLPVVMKSLDYIGLLDCKVKSNRCELTRTAVFAY